MRGLITHVEAIIRSIRAEPWPMKKVGRVYVVCGPTAGRRAGGACGSPVRRRAVRAKLRKWGGY